MAEPIHSFFARRMTPSNGPSAASDPSPLHLAACALMLELAHADNNFGEPERMHIEAVLRRHFGLDEETALTLMRLADEARKNAGDMYQFAALIRDNYDLGQKTLLAEIMWGLILTDGDITRHEATILQNISKLLDLQPGYLAEARSAAAARLN